MKRNYLFPAVELIGITLFQSALAASPVNIQDMNEIEDEW